MWVSSLLSRYTTLISGAPELTKARGLSLAVKSGWRGRTTTDPPLDGQNDNGCSQVSAGVEKHELGKHYRAQRRGESKS